MRSLRAALVRHAPNPGSWPRRHSSTARHPLRVPVVALNTLGLDGFREQAFLPEKPLLVAAGQDHHGEQSPDTGSEGALPAIGRWFGADASGRMSLRPYLEEFAMASLRYELMYPPSLPDSAGPPGSQNAVSSFCAWLVADQTSQVRPALAELVRYHVSALETEQAQSGQRFIQIQAPLLLLLEALRYNKEAPPAAALTHLYVAQASLSHLPAALQQDLPAPTFVRQGGRGDVYDTSLWLGLEPTYSPWHRDPNPNLFCQLCSRKTVRLLPPTAGERVFQQVQTELMKSAAGPRPAAHARIRGAEMMQGPERRVLHEAVWGPAADAAMQEADVNPGDMLFIPKGWWHSVKSGFADGRLNASANWWFR